MKVRRLVFLWCVLFAACGRQAEIAPPTPDSSAAASEKPECCCELSRQDLFVKALANHQKTETAPAPVEKDKTTQEVEKLLQPALPVPQADRSETPKNQPAPSFLDNPELPPFKYKGVPPHPGLEKGPPVVPKHISEGPALLHDRRQPEKPGDIRLPEQTRVHVPSSDVNEPIALPILAQAKADRVSLADPTFAASLQAILKSRPPLRQEQAPFQAINLPDPFEFHHAARLRAPLPEDPLPPLPWPRRPGN